MNSRIPYAVIVALVAISLSLFQLYTAGFRTLNLFYQRGIHLGFILVLAFLLYPAKGRGTKRSVVDWLVDGLFIAGATYATNYLVLNLDAIINRAGFWQPRDLLVGTIAIVVLLEASRRVIGPVITVIAGSFIVYAMAGSRGSLPYLGEFLPGILAHKGYKVDRIVAQLYLGQEGILGIPLGVAATYVFIFILFGAFLEITGAGQFFIDLAYAIAGRQRGGPAKAAVVASGFLGSISGSAIANVVASGTFSIPLMKRLGYSKEEAGGVEAAASTGGQIMPPIMGAGAFLIAEYTGRAYAQIVMLSILPAIMYFATVYLFVDIIAAKKGMRGLERAELPQLREVLGRGWHFLLPIAWLVYRLIVGISPTRVGFEAIVALLLVAGARATVRLLRRGGPSPIQALWNALKSLTKALETGATNAVPVTLACAVAGIVVGIIGLTGLGLKFSSLMLSFSQGNLLLALLLVALASLVLGLGLPVTASYIVLAVLTAPALQSEFGVPLLIAHLLIFWYSQDSNVTPPVALAAFAGAGIAGGDPMRTGFAAWKFAKGLYLIPLFMIYKPEFITGGPWLIVVWQLVSACLALWAFTVALEGFMVAPVNWLYRILLAISTVTIFWPNFLVQGCGVLVIVGLMALNMRRPATQG